MAYKDGFVIEYDDSIRKYMNCLDCIYANIEDNCCEKYSWVFREDSYNRYKECDDYQLKSDIPFEKEKKQQYEKWQKIMQKKIAERNENRAKKVAMAKRVKDILEPVAVIKEEYSSFQVKSCSDLEANFTKIIELKKEKGSFTDKEKTIKKLLKYNYGNSDRFVWILYGQKGKGIKKIALQIEEGPTPSLADDLLEIIDYIYAPANVISSGEKIETKDSEFYANVYKSCGKNMRKYAYGQIGRSYEHLWFYMVDVDKYLGLSGKRRKGVEQDLIDLSKSYYAEAKLALNTLPLFWNKFNGNVGGNAFKLIKKEALSKK